ncbi:MAG: hypothetical protein C4295_09020 [Candidatus Fervidibacterota bacterium]
MAGVPFRVLWCQGKQGKSIMRILTNWVLAQWRDEVKGLVLDLACGTEPSYRRILGLTEIAHERLVSVDYNPACRPTIVADLTRTLPFRDQVADTAILSSFLYIPPEPVTVLQEVRRVLKHEGLLLLTAPLIFPYHPEPTDHWRFTEEGLRYVCARAGFRIESIVPIGGRWTAVAYLIAPFLRPRWLVAPVVYCICLYLDMWTSRWFTRLPPCPIGYVVKARPMSCA